MGDDSLRSGPQNREVFVAFVWKKWKITLTFYAEYDWIDNDLTLI